MISTKASAVSGPTPGWVISRRASGHFSTSCWIAWLSSAIVGFSRSSNSRRSRRRRLAHGRSEEHTSELQSQFHLVCRLLLEKKKKNKNKQLHQNKKKQKKRKI